MIQNDTQSQSALKLDPKYLKEIQNSKVHDYLSEIHEIKTETETTTITETQSTGDAAPTITSQVLSYIGIGILAAVLIFIIWKIVKEYLLPSDDDYIDGMDSQLGSDTITGHQWDSEIMKLLAEGKYSEVVVLCFLRYLAHLDNAGIIRFRVFKTPGMFIAETAKYIKKNPSVEPNTLDKLKQLTTNYLRVRYGHHSADKATADKMLSL